jgi:hypothetical protein
MSRCRRIIGNILGSYSRPAQGSKTGLPSPSSTECSTSDARSPSAPPDYQGIRIALRFPASVHQSNVCQNRRCTIGTTLEPMQDIPGFLTASTQSAEESNFFAPSCPQEA